LAALAAEVGVLPSEDWLEKHDIIIPAHWRTGGATEKDLASLEKEFKELSEGKMVPDAVFRSLAGSWTLKTQINNRLDASMSGTVTGTATFTPTTSLNEYLYSEIGEFRVPSGKHFKVHQKYVYVFDNVANRIDVFFEDQGTRSHLFHSLNFLPRESSSVVGSSGSKGWRAEGQHLCVKDMYYPSYRFQFQGNNLAEMEISYNVVGPQKDYTKVTTFVR
jgi:hypothetical protein